jgi:hypothetical protein
MDELDRTARVDEALRTAASLDWPHVAACFFDLYDALHRRFQKLREVPVAVQAAPDECSTVSL